MHSLQRISDMQAGDEAELIRAAKADPQRFAPLYERYFPEIFRFLLRRAQDQELTADLTQQTFLKAMLSLDRYQDKGFPFKAWLYRIALNEIRMYWRRKKEVVMDMGQHEAWAIAEEVGVGADAGDLQRLAKALSRLDERKARLIELRYMDGLGFAEIGAVLGIREDAAKMRTHRVLNLLRTYLSPRA
jgi:RNA polymerase sigma-70 factor, ECF subfamily